jgi:hypothetical protein
VSKPTFATLQAREARRTSRAALAAERDAALARAEKLEGALEGITSELERTVAEADRPKGGMRVPFHGDFASALQLPSVVGRFRWWARNLRAALNTEEGTG